MVTLRRLLLATLGATLLLAAPARAGIWTAVNSGLTSTDQIRAIEYQSPTRLWLATSSGKIATRQADGSFSAQNVIGPTYGFNDIAFKPGSPIGLAVGANGKIYRSANAGGTWSQVNFSELQTNSNTSKPYACGSYRNVGVGGNLPSTTDPAITLYSVKWGPGSRVFVTGAQSTILRSDDDGASFTEINKYQAPDSSTSYKDIDCRIDPDSDHAYYDVQPAPTDPGTGDAQLPVYFLADDGHVYFTDDGLSAGGTPAATSDIGCGGVFGRFVLDPANPVDQWSAVDRGSNSSCLYYTTTTDPDNYQFLQFPNQGSSSFNASEDIAGAGSAPPTLVTVGKGGDILNSVDGVNFYVNKLSPTDTSDYFAVSGFDKANFAVGGAGGRLLLTTAASTIPDLVPPAGVISGPATVVAGAPVSFTASVADNNGGSGIDPGSFSWASAGLPGATGNPVSLTFPAPGYYSVTVSFRDNAGNPATASLGVQAVSEVHPTPVKTTPVSTAPTTKTKTATADGARLTLKGPAACVKAGGSFTVTLSVKKQKKKGNKFVKVSRVDFSVDGKKAKTDRKAPFSQRLTIKKLKAGSKHSYGARSYIKVKHGKSPKKSIASSFTVC